MDTKKIHLVSLFEQALQGEPEKKLEEIGIVVQVGDGVSKVYDNRDGLAANAKRPWFRAVEGEKAYWAPRTKG